YAHIMLAVSSIFFFILRPPPRFTLFPYTTLFRSLLHLSGGNWRQIKMSARQVFATDQQFAIKVKSRKRELLICCEYLPSRHFYRSEEHTSELQSRENLVCRLLLEKKKKKKIYFCY